MHRTLKLGLVVALLSARIYAAEAQPAAVADAGIERGAAPAWVHPLPWSIPTEPAAPGAPAEIILSDSQCRLTPDGSDYYFHVVTRLVNAEGVRQNAEPSVSYEPSYEKITWHSLRITRDGVVSDRFPAAKFKKLQRELGLEAQIYTGNITAAVVLDDVRVGDILEYEYTFHSANPVLKGHMSSRHYLGSVYPVRQQVVLVHTPASEPELSWSFFVPAGVQNLPREIFQHAALRAALERPLTPEDVEENNRSGKVSTLPVVENERTYRWSGKNIPGIEFDNNIPPSASPYYPLLRCDNFKSWSAVVDWAEPLFSSAIVTLPDDMRQLTAKWKHDYPNSIDRLAAAIHWVQDDVRYFAFAMGEHNLRPRPLPEVCSGRLGDCKDKSVLLTAMLRELGFEAWPALVNSYWGNRIRDYGPAAHAFDHVIVAYKQGDQLCWIDPTFRQQQGPPGKWAVPPYRWALILRPNQDELTAIPEPDQSEPDTTTRDLFTIDPATGTAVLAIEIRLRGLQSDIYRQRLLGLTPDQMSRNWFDFIGRFYKRMKEVEPPKAEDDHSTNVITVRARYSIPDFVRTEKGQSIVSTYAYQLRSLIDPPQSIRRHWPYALSTDRFIRHRIEVELPFPLTLDQQSQLITSDGIAYRVEKGLVGNRLVEVHDLHLTKNAVTADQMDDFCDAVDDMVSCMGTTVHRRIPTKPASADATN